MSDARTKDASQPSAAKFDAAIARRLWTFIRPHQRLIWFGLTLLLVMSACRLALPYLVKLAIDDYLVPRDLDGFYLIAGGFFAIALVEFLVRRRQMYTVDLAGQSALFDLRTHTFRKLQRLPASYFDKRPTGALVGRVTTDIEALQELFSTGVVTILGDLVFLGATVVILFSLNWQLTLVTLAAVPVLLVVTVFIRVRVRAAYVELRKQLAKLNAFLHEHLAGMPVVQSLLQEARVAGRFSDVIGDVRASQLRSVWWESNFSAVTEMIGSLTLALILWYGGGLALGNAGEGSALTQGLTLGTLFAFIDYMQRFFTPLSELSQKYTVLQNAMTAARRIFDLLDEEEEKQNVHTVGALPPATGRIEFQNVSFAYREDEPVICDLTFTAEPGEKIAVVGPTGSGKTTLLKILTRLYEIQDGRILLDGVDIRDYPLQELRRRIGLVPQEVFLFEGNVIDNVRLGHPEVDEQQAMEAANRLHLGDLVKRLPRGYHEPVAERGKNLSAGEKQLLSFARALAASPRILALDEATSNVDSHTEHLLQEAVHEVMTGRTALIIAHRLSTIRDADRIFVMKRGAIDEQGTHEELLAKRGTYWRLYQLQYRQQEGGTPPAA